MVAKIFFSIEHGDPHQKGALIHCEAGDLLLGRSWEHSHPDLAFTNLCVSRKHALVVYRDNQFFLTDLGSKHGTSLNGQDLPPHKLFPLRHGDNISLAKGMVSLTFYNPNEAASGETVELSSPTPASNTSASCGLVIEPERRQVFLNNSPVPLRGKDLDLLLLLYNKRNRPVPYNDIRLCIWPERTLDCVTGVPDVGKDEIAALIYRLRKRLGEYGDLIVSLPRYGYILEIIS